MMEKACTHARDRRSLGNFFRYVRFFLLRIYGTAVISRRFIYTRDRSSMPHFFISDLIGFFLDSHAGPQLPCSAILKLGTAVP